MDMMAYLFVARTHGACVNTLNFDACVRASDNFVACRTRCRFLCVYTLIIVFEIALYMNFDTRKDIVPVYFNTY